MWNARMHTPSTALERYHRSLPNALSPELRRCPGGPWTPRPRFQDAVRVSRTHALNRQRGAFHNHDMYEVQTSHTTVARDSGVRDAEIGSATCRERA